MSVQRGNFDLNSSTIGENISITNIPISRSFIYCLVVGRLFQAPNQTHIGSGYRATLISSISINLVKMYGSDMGVASWEVTTFL